MNEKEKESNRSKESIRTWLRLLSCETVIEQQLRSRFRQEFSVTLPQFDVLSELERAGRKMTMSELSRELMVSNGNVTGVIDRLEKNLIESMRSQVDDPETQEKLIPDYSFFCKRPSFSNTYYGCFNRKNVSLVTEPIERVVAEGVRTRDGVVHPFDVIVCATGYSVFDPSCMPNFEIVGRAGRSLGEEWARPEDEDDGLVVMLKARIENLQGQLAAFEKRGAGPRGSANERS